MLKKIFIFTVIQTLCIIHVFAQLRSFNDVFPNVSGSVRAETFSENGFFKTGQSANRQDLIAAGNSINPQIFNSVISMNPGHLIESIHVIPGSFGSADAARLRIYNALSQIRGLKGRTYDSHSRNQSVPLFEDATRIASERQTNAVNDPPPASSVPARETIFLRLRDANFGNSFYKAEMTVMGNGICYTLSNNRNLTYLMVPVIREGNFVAVLYLEPIREGILIYGIAGANVSDFVASRIHMSSAISKRLEVIIDWVTDGIRAGR